MSRAMSCGKLVDRRRSHPPREEATYRNRQYVSTVKGPSGIYDVNPYVMSTTSKAQRAKYPVNEPTTRIVDSRLFILKKKKKATHKVVAGNRAGKLATHTSFDVSEREDALIPPGTATPARRKLRIIRPKKLLRSGLVYFVVHGPRPSSKTQTWVCSSNRYTNLCDSDSDCGTQLNGSHGEWTEGDDVRVEVICHACIAAWDDTLYVRNLLQTSGVIVQHEFCCICMETNGFDDQSGFIQVGDICYSQDVLPWSWKFHSRALVNYYTHASKEPSLQRYMRPYLAWSRGEGDEAMENACVTSFLRSRYNDIMRLDPPEIIDYDGQDWLQYEMDLQSATNEDMEVVTQLNGSHGEWTEGDDMSSTSSITQENARRRKESKNKQKQHKSDNRDNKGVNQVPGQPPAASAPNKEIEEEKGEEPPRPVLYLVRSKTTIYIWYKGDLYTRRFGIQGFNHPYSGPTGELFETVEAGTVLQNVVEHGYGFAKVLVGKGVPVKVSGSMYIKNEKVAHSSKPEPVAVCVPFEHALKQQFPSATRDQTHARTAARALAAKQFTNLPEDYVVGTIHKFFSARDRVAVDVERLNTNEGREEDFNINRLGVSQQHDQPWRSYGTNAVAEFNWELREDVYMDEDKSEGVTTTYDRYTYGNDVVVPTAYHKFATLEDERVRFYHTHMCQFRSEHNQFTAYEPNGHNANLALKRVFGCNDHNRVYTMFQYNLTNSYTHGLEQIERQAVLDLLKVRETAATYIVGRGEHRHVVERTTHMTVASPGELLARVKLVLPHLPDWFDEECISEAYSEVRSSIRKNRDILKSRCSQYMLERVTDGIQNLSHWAYAKCAIGYYSVLDAWNQRHFNVFDIQHHKMEMRKVMFKNIQLNHDSDCLVKKIALNVKKEWAKPGKVGRLFASYGSGGIYAPELPEFLKACIHGAYVLEGEVSMTIYIMSKARDNEINETFRHILDTMDLKNHIHYIVYSDDSCMVGDFRGTRVMANMDISSCDASNRFPIFLGVYNLLRNFSEKRAYGLLEQCTKEMLLVNPSNPLEKMFINFHSCMEGSGTVLTTVLNHTVSYDIGVAIHSMINTLPGLKFDDAVRLGALMVGHKLTIDHCPVIEKLQFLKRSPIMLDDGTYHMCLNYGTIFRGFGCVEGDLEARQLGVSSGEFDAMAWEERLNKFAKVVVQGLVHEPSSQVVDSLRDRFEAHEQFKLDGCVSPDGTLDQFYLFVPRNNGAGKRVDEASLARRYGCGVHDFGVLAEQVMKVRIGSIMPSAAVTAFFAVDYGL